MTPTEVLKRVLYLLVVLGIALFGSTAWGATVPELDIDELTRYSDTIVVGEVVDVTARVEGRHVVSTISVSVEAVWKGESIDMVQIHHRGGRTPNLATVVPGMPDFAVGERALLFLEARRSGGFVTTGLAQGKFSIARAPDGTDVVFPARHHGELRKQTDIRIGPIELPPAVALWSVATRLEEIAELVAKAGEKR